MTIKTIADLTTRFADNQTQDIAEEDLRDLLDSIAGVGGLAYTNGTTSNIASNWTLFTAFDESKDTKGLTFDPLTGEFIVATGADGYWIHIAFVTVTPPASGNISLAFAKNPSTTPVLSAVRPVYDMTVSESRTLFVFDGASYAAGDRFGLAWDGSGSAAVTVDNGAMLAIRI